MDQKNIFESVPERFSELFAEISTVWQPLDRLKDWIGQNIKPGNHGLVKGNVYIEGEVEIGEGTVIEHGAVIVGPTIIGKNCQIRSGAYIRGNVVTGDNCVIGHVTEVIRTVLFDGVRLDHFNYVGDSILGNKVHFGAGAKVANLRFDEKNILVEGVDTGRKKFGLVAGDSCQLGVNVAVGPGIILETNTWVTAAGHVKGGVYSRADFLKK